MTDSSEEVKLRVLVEELANVVDWFHLGIYLDVPDSELMKIRCNYQDVDQRKTQALSVWLKMKKGSWSDIVRALIGIRMKTLAIHIATKYGEFMSSEYIKVYREGLCMLLLVHALIPCLAVYTAIVSLIFGTVIPTSFTLLSLVFLWIFPCKNNALV